MRAAIHSFVEHFLLIFVDGYDPASMGVDEILHHQIITKIYIRRDWGPGRERRLIVGKE